MLTGCSALAHKPVRTATIIQTGTQDSRHNNNPHMCLEANLLFNRPCLPLLLGLLGRQILMPLMEAIRTTFRCGMPLWQPNSNKQAVQVKVSNDEAC